MTNEIEQKEVHFDTVAELIEYLNVPKPTFYRRAKALEISTTKGTYTADEIRALKKPLSNPNRGKSTKKEQPKASVTSQKSHDELIEVMRNQIEQQNVTIKDLQEQLKVKDTQIAEASEALKRSQQLQLLSTKQGRRWYQFWLPRDI